MDSTNSQCYLTTQEEMPVPIPLSQTPSNSRDLARRICIVSFLIGLSVSVFAAALSHRHLQLEDAARFEAFTSDIQKRIEDRLERYRDFLIQAQAFARTNGEVTREQWHRYISEAKVLTMYPGIQGIGLTVRLKPDEIKSHIARVRSEGFPNYQVWPAQPARDDYFSIVFLEPFDWRNQRAFGFDMFTEPTRRRAMEQARDTGKPATSGRVILVQETREKTQPGFLIYVPLYRPGSPHETVEQRRESLLGFVYSPFRSEDLIRASIAEELDAVTFRLFDGASTKAEDLIYEAIVPSSGEDSGRFEKVSQITLPGHHVWTAQFRAHAEFNNPSARLLPMIVLFIGSIASALLSLLLQSRKKQQELQEQARVNAEHLRSKLNSFFMQAPAMVMLCRGPDHTVELVNYRSLASLGQRNIIGKPIRAALPMLEGQGIFEKMDEVYETGIPFAQREYPVFDVTCGNTRYYDTVVQPLTSSEGQVTGLMTHSIDVTEQVRGRKKIEDLVERLESAVSARDEFLSIASHELKTPLTSLKLQTGLHQKLRSQGSSPTADRLIELIDRQVDRLSRLVDDMLDLSRISAGKLTIEPEQFELKSMIDETLERLFPLLTEAQCEVTTEVPAGISVLWDRFRMEQVLTNLITNAAKYGAGKPIHLTAAVLGEDVRIDVQDHGIGIAKEHQERIFQRFERAVSNGIAGLGLGLYISRQIVLKHQGQIELKSAPGEGTTFSIIIPANIPTARQGSHGLKCSIEPLTERVASPSS